MDSELSPYWTPTEPHSVVPVAGGNYPLTHNARHSDHQTAQLQRNHTELFSRAGYAWIRCLELRRIWRTNPLSYPNWYSGEVWWPQRIVGWPSRNLLVSYCLSPWVSYRPGISLLPIRGDINIIIHLSISEQVPYGRWPSFLSFERMLPFFIKQFIIIIIYLWNRIYNPSNRK